MMSAARPAGFKLSQFRFCLIFRNSILASFDSKAWHRHIMELKKIRPLHISSVHFHGCRVNRFNLYPADRRYPHNLRCTIYSLSSKWIQSRGQHSINRYTHWQRYPVYGNYYKWTQRAAAYNGNVLEGISMPRRNQIASAAQHAPQREQPPPTPPPASFLQYIPLSSMTNMDNAITHCHECHP